jgi:sugar transferase EpsL
MWKAFGKPTFDMILSTTALICLSPLLLLIAILVRAKLGSPVLFSQLRPGRSMKPFTLYKFRTMKAGNDLNGQLLPDSERLTEFGAWLRSTSLDELPELFNVLRRDMSLVGPRPLLMQYVSRYSDEQARRNDVRPGITGWAQVNGRNSLSWEDKFRLDTWYVDHQGFWLDAVILVRTIITTLKRVGIQQDGQATASEFMGSAVDPNADSSTGT